MYFVCLKKDDHDVDITESALTQCLKALEQSIFVLLPGPIKISIFLINNCTAISTFSYCRLNSYSLALALCAIPPHIQSLRLGLACLVTKDYTDCPSLDQVRSWS